MRGVGVSRCSSRSQEALIFMKHAYSGCIARQKDARQEQVEQESATRIIQEEYLMTVIFPITRLKSLICRIKRKPSTGLMAPNDYFLGLANVIGSSPDYVVLLLELYGFIRARSLYAPAWYFVVSEAPACGKFALVY